MADPVNPSDETLLEGLSEEERTHLEIHRWVQSDGDVAWIEPGGQLRRERASRLYYVATDRGVFRVSRISREVIEV